MTSQWLTVTPRDTVFVRDGRGFDAGTPTEAESVMPWPSTVAGAVSAAAGGAEFTAARGPVLLADEEMLFPVPADLTVVNRQTRRMNVGTSPAGVSTDLSAVVPGVLVAADDAERLEGLTTGAGLSAYLAGKDWVPLRTGAMDPVTFERRIGLTRVDRKAVDGRLYTARHLRLRENAGFAVQVDTDTLPDPLTSPVNFGGENRLADVTTTDLAWPTAPHNYPDGRILLYVATPGIWPDGWRPPLPAGVSIVAAAVNEPVPVAIASPKNVGPGGLTQTSQLWWAVPAGSVYLLQADLDDPAAWAATVHAAAIGATLPDPYERLRTAGFGVVFTGVWSPSASLEGAIE